MAIRAVLALLVFVFCADGAKAAHYRINLNDLNGGIPGSGGSLSGPCYCSPNAGFISRAYLFNPGDTVDFGNVEIFSVEAMHSGSGPLPDFRVFVQSYINVGYNYVPHSHPYSDTNYSMFYSYNLDYNYNPVSSYALHLFFEIPSYGDSIQFSWFGQHTYTPPVPEASTWAMMLLGFAGIGFVALRRRQTAVVTL